MPWTLALPTRLEERLSAPKRSARLAVELADSRGDAEAERLFFDKAKHLSKNELPQRQDPENPHWTNDMSYKIRLDVFEGPLDLLLYLIKKEELDIYDIPITKITEQYLETLSLMELLDLDVAGEFLVMAATLMQIKSKMLLPPDPDGVETEEEDPRAELVRRLLEYKAYKEAADRLREFDEKRSGIYARFGVEPEIDGGDSPFCEVSLFELISAFSKVLKNLPREDYHQVVKDEFTVAEKVHEIFHRLVKEPKIYFSALFKAAKNKFEVITTFLALLELIRLKEVGIHQGGHFGEIEIFRNARNIEAQPPAAPPSATA